MHSRYCLGFENLAMLKNAVWVKIFTDKKDKYFSNNFGSKHINNDICFSLIVPLKLCISHAVSYSSYSR